MLRRRALLLCAALPFVPGLASAQNAAPGSVNVLYAGSLVTLMEHGIGPAFDASGGGRFQGYAGGSNGLANQIKGRLRRGDVFISASPKVNAALMGSANGDWISWYVAFAQSPLVIGYNASSRFAADLLDKAATLYHLPDLPQKVLGGAENPAQVFPEENLVGRLQSGQLDVGFFYSTETADLKIAAIELPKETALSAHYTATVLHGAPNPAGAERFVALLLGPKGQAIMRQHGLDLVRPRVSGDASAVPPAIRAVLPAAP